MLELKNISVGYGKQSVLEDATASFEPGKLTAVIGLNGCGKSTLLKSALGILPISRGKITVDEHDLQSMSRTDIARRIAYLSQGKAVVDMTVEQMVLHGRFPHLTYPRRYRSHDREIAKEAMRTVGIADVSNKPLCELSGGMRQNAYIAMALAQDTDYILLDEPTTYLDIPHQLELMKLLRDLAKSGKGIVAVMHDLPLAFNFSDEIVLINGGRIQSQSTPEELCKSSVIKDIFRVSVSRTESQGKYHYDFM